MFPNAKEFENEKIWLKYASLRFSAGLQQKKKWVLAWGKDVIILIQASASIPRSFSATLLFFRWIPVCSVAWSYYKRYITNKDLLLFYHESDQTLAQLTQRCFGVSPLEMFRNHLEMAPCQAALFEQVAWTRWPPESPYDLIYSEFLWTAEIWSAGEALFLYQWYVITEKKSK